MTKIKKSQQEVHIPLPPAAAEPIDYGFVGRHAEIQALQRLLVEPSQVGLIVHGIAGVGKTTLIQGFLQNLQHTGSLNANIFWFLFDEIRSFEYIINRMIEGLFGAEVLATPLQRKMDNLCKVLIQNPFILVWDNFEAADGNEELGIASLLLDEDKRQLKEFLQRLHQGKSKVIIVSRSSENWLSETACGHLSLDGLVAEGREQYCRAVIKHFDLAVNVEEAAYGHLMKRLGGHPLTMRVVLLKLDETPINILLQEFEQGLNDAPSDEKIACVDAALGLLESSLPPEYTAVLQFIGLHRRYVQLNTLTDMMRNSELVTSRLTIEECITVLEHTGLMRAQKKDIYTLHPILNEYLERHHPAEIAVLGAFVDLMGRFADHLAPKDGAVQRAPFFIHSANFHHALSLANTMDMVGHVIALTQALAISAQNNQDFKGAARLFESLAKRYNQLNDELGLASCYHQLGKVAQQQHDFKQGEMWYLKSLAIKQALGDAHSIANTYAQLGTLERMQQHWIKAAQWYVKAAVIFNENGDEESAARIANIYLALLQLSGVQHQDEIKVLWQQSGLVQTVGSLDALRDRSNP